MEAEPVEAAAAAKAEVKALEAKKTNTRQKAYSEKPTPLMTLHRRVSEKPIKQWATNNLI